MRKVGESIFERDIDPDSEWLNPNYELISPEFDEVEIQITAWCNRTCSFCPSGTFDVPKAVMSLDTIDRIIDNLEPIEFSGTIGLHLMCESLLHTRFHDVVARFRERLPNVFIRIESNGDALDKDFDRLNAFFEAGLNEILINCYDSKGQRDSRNKKIQSLCHRFPSIWYWNEWMRTPPGEKKQWRMIKLRDFYEKDYSLRNWAGHVDLQRPDKLSFPIPMGCARPFRRVHINYLGQVILCNNDWKFEVVIGDLTSQPLSDVWNAPLLLEYRKKLLAKDRSMPLCRTCDAGVPWIKEPPCSPAGPWTALRLRTRDAVGFLRAVTNKAVQNIAQLR